MPRLKKKRRNQQASFPSVKILAITAVVAVLIGIIVIAVTPNDQRADSRNAQRSTDIAAILSAVYQYAVDNNAIPSTITTSNTEICATRSSSCSNLTDLAALTVSSKYLVSIPKDPRCSVGCDVNGTGYKIRKDSSNRVMITAPLAENDEIISLTR